MQTLQQSIGAVYFPAEKRKQSILTRFISWCKEQEENRLGWLAGIIASHGCFITPWTIFIVTYTGNNMFLFMAATIAMGVALVTNLAALPTKITIPVYVLSIIIDLGIILTSLTMSV